MHILVPTGIFHPESGGPATYLYHLLPDLLAAGHSVEVLTFSDDTPTESYPYPIERIPRTNLIHRNWRYRRAVQTRLPQADVVFINSLGLWLPKLTKPSVIKIVGDRAWERCVNRGWIPSTEDIDHFQTARYSPLVNWVKYARSQEAQAPDRVIVPSQYLKQMVAGWGVPAERIEVIYNAFEPPNMAPHTNKSALGLSEEAPLFLVVARLTPWKGIDLVLQALVEIPHVQVVIAGDGSMQAEWQALAQQLGLAERVQFLGRVSQQILAQYYAAADYTVLYSGYEGLSHVLLESLHAGTPIIASDKGGNPETVIHGENGLLVPYPDVNALRVTFHQALDPTTQQRLKVGAALDVERFSWTRMRDHTLRILEETARR